MGVPVRVQRVSVRPIAIISTVARHMYIVSYLLDKDASQARCARRGAYESAHTLRGALDRGGTDGGCGSCVGRAVHWRRGSASGVGQAAGAGRATRVGPPRGAARPWAGAARRSSRPQIGASHVAPPAAPHTARARLGKEGAGRSTNGGRTRVARGAVIQTFPAAPPIGHTSTPHPLITSAAPLARARHQRASSCMTPPKRAHRAQKIMQTPLACDQADIRAALDRPASFYHAYAQRAAVGAALALFRSERDVHQTERLDLVTWVQYICGFGCVGPSEDAWTQLFHACRLQEGLAANADPGAAAPADLSAGDYLREHEIAVLLAHAKVSPDAADAMTHATLVKHRIRPAVFGRNDARTPGIIRHVSAKFEDWIFGYMTKWMCHYIVEEFSPRDFVPGLADLSLFASNVLNIRNCANAHAAKNVKDWAVVIMQLLEIDHNSLSPRAVRFERKLRETRLFLFLQFYAKISEYFLNTLQVSAAALVADAPSADSESEPRQTAVKSEMVADEGHARTQDTLLYAAMASRGYHATSPSLSAPAYATIKALCGLRTMTSSRVGPDLMDVDGGRTSGGPI